MVDVGAFRLLAPLGRGGMGEVWRGVHAASGLPVAVKWVRVRRQASVAAFRDEVRAVAGLDHPHVVWVLDHGELDGAAAEALGASPGLPWLAMELTTGGTLADGLGAVGWREVRRILHELLDALAHAHARGVVHRDLKPANVLLDRHGAVKLTDFGLAHLADAHVPEELASSGTPSYMAPEQCRGEWRAFGPWTDLYALGCVAWALLTGRPPFARSEPRAVLLAHLASPLPAMSPSCPVPAGLEGWLRTLLEKDPARRFRRAADAACALAALPDADDERPAGPRPVDAAGPTLSVVSRPVVPLRWNVQGTDAASARPPPCPTGWRREHVSPRPAALHGAGLGLYGLRAVPLVGREALCDELWASLVRVHATGAPACVVLRGPSGCGKSRLASWLCERAHEVGAASAVAVVHDPHGGPASGLRAALERAFRLRGLAAHDHARQLEVVLPGAADELSRAFGRLDGLPSRARREILLDMLAALAAERPVVVWIDDVQWGAEALRLALAALGGRARLLLVLTVREEALAEQPVEDVLLQELSAHPEAVTLAPGPLGDADARALVQALLPLDERLAARIESRVRGNPLFAVQLVGDWVGRGLLRVGPHGFALRPGSEPPLPDDLHAVWSARVVRLLADRPPTDGVALTLAALLGQEVDGQEWRLACDAAGVPCDVALVDSLALARLASAARGHEGWAFVHGMFRESLCRDAPAELHRACAQAVAGSGGPGASPRIADHLLGAGDPEKAAVYLVRHAIELHNEHAVAEGRGVVARLEALADAHGWPPTHRARVDARVRSAALHLLAGDTDGALRDATEGARLAEARGEPRLLAEALHHQAGACADRGDHERAVAILERAVALCAGTPHAHSIGLTLAHALGKVGRIAEGERLARASVDAFDGMVGLLRAHGRLRAYSVLTELALERGAWGEADAWATRTLEACGDDPRLQARAVAGLLARGEVARHDGDLAAAERWCEAAVDADRRAGGTQGGRHARASLALVRLLRGDPADAARRARQVLDDTPPRRDGVQAVAWLILACAESEPAAWAAAVDGALGCGSWGGGDRDLRWLALRAAAGATDAARAAALDAFAGCQCRGPEVSPQCGRAAPR